MRAMMEWYPEILAVAMSSLISSSPTPRPRAPRCTYTEFSTVEAYAGRERKGENTAKPRILSSCAPISPTTSSSLIATKHGCEERCVPIHSRLLLERARYQVEGVGGLENFEVVDGHQRLRVSTLDQAGSHRLKG